MAVETREASPAHILIKIESFSLLKKRGLSRYESREFDAGNYKWRLVIYPNGHGAGISGDYVSVFLAISGTDSLPKHWEVNALFSICVFDQMSDAYVYTPAKTRRFVALQTEWGFPKFISRKDLTTPSNGYLIDDSCLFGAEVFINDSKVVTQCLSLKNDRVPYKHATKIFSFSKCSGFCYSEEFTTGGYKWKIIVFPNDETLDIERPKPSLCICLVYVASDTCDERVKACYTVCLKNQGDSRKDHKRTSSNWFGASNSTWGWRPFISLDEMGDRNGGFLVKDTCLLEIEIYVQAVAQ